MESLGSGNAVRRQFHGKKSFSSAGLSRKKSPNSTYEPLIPLAV
jgi:hypothetical protein